MVKFIKAVDVHVVHTFFISTKWQTSEQLEQTYLRIPTCHHTLKMRTVVINQSEILFRIRFELGIQLMKINKGKG